MHESRKRPESTTKNGGEMKRLVEFPLEEGGNIVVEIDYRLSQRSGEFRRDWTGTRKATTP
jgi:hypothetical protein